MKYYAKPLSKLISELSRLPGIGGKTAQRLAFHILSMDEKEALALAESITEAKKNMKYCSVCGNLTDTDPCMVCSDPARDRSVICVVETPGLGQPWNGSKNTAASITCFMERFLPWKGSDLRTSTSNS